MDIGKGKKDVGMKSGLISFFVFARKCFILLAKRSIDGYGE